ncbi:hypothetical protein GGR50DRAFT_260282 [Xylaria sp. CBS 124048]|nr:hypothetical protein GGR50DRAFT_260282 [Xylaria sp. CBS 124048]
MSETDRKKRAAMTTISLIARLVATSTVTMMIMPLLPALGIPHGLLLHETEYGLSLVVPVLCPGRAEAEADLHWTPILLVSFSTPRGRGCRSGGFDDFFYPWMRGSGAYQHTIHALRHHPLSLWLWQENCYSTPHALPRPDRSSLAENNCTESLASRLERWLFCP